MEARRSENTIVVRMDRGEHVLEKLDELREAYQIKNGFFQAIGAVDRVTLAHYDVDTQEYTEQQFEAPFEVTSFSGNIGPDKIHAHITVADDSYRAKAGHCSGARVSGTFEMIVLLSDDPVLTHAFDEETGLDLFNLSG
jgi:predicted DNA-binding protein with PD1-like motif